MTSKTKSSHCPAQPVRPSTNSRQHGRHPLRFSTWSGMWTLIGGMLAVLWLLLRSGSKPSRFLYPCQQAAISAASLAFGVPLIAALIAARRRAVSVLRTGGGAIGMAGAVLVTAGLWSYLSSAEIQPGTRHGLTDDYRAQVFCASECPQEPIGSRFVGLDNLISLMGREGLKFYRSATDSPVAGPEGLISANDVVVIKINYQWDARGGTNVDVLRGLVQRLVEHPDTFTGEIVICENAQFASVSNFDRASNNAQDHGLSPHDVVVQYQGLGHQISHYDWTVRRGTQVNEYHQGDMNDGYVVADYNAEIQGRVSYPKFQTSHGTRISLKYGIWDSPSSSYDRTRLRFINMPVLKSHHSTYGVTACVKNYMGVVTGLLSTNSHNAIRWGVLGALLAEVQLADLNLLDCVWINANPNSGPATPYAGATRRDMLVAGRDPVAVDIWAAKNILVPAFLENGYSPPWPEPSADPDDPTSDFRQYLDNSMNQILLRDVVTNNPAQIDAFMWNGDGDFDGDSDVDQTDREQFAACFTGPAGGPIPPECQAGDFDDDTNVDCDDWCQFLQVWTELGDPPGLPACQYSGDLNSDGGVNASDLALLLGAWGPCSGCPADLDGNGVVDAADLALLLGNWGVCG